jgi:hypothetical protein
VLPESTFFTENIHRRKNRRHFTVSQLGGVFLRVVKSIKSSKMIEVDPVKNLNSDPLIVKKK